MQLFNKNHKNLTAARAKKLKMKQNYKHAAAIGRLTKREEPHTHSNEEECFKSYIPPDPLDKINTDNGDGLAKTVSNYFL